LPRPASVALTLKVVCGFGVAEIARAFLSTETAIEQRLVRAKKMIRDQAVRFEVPDPQQLDERLGAVLEVLYLLFTEGYAATAGDRLIKNDLCAEAIRLAESLAENSATAQPECHALLALMFFQAARLPARTDALGDLLLLEEQDRSLWDRSMIHLGLLHLERAARGDKLSAYHLQAEIAAMHSTTEHFTLTNWENILALYDLLSEKQPTPVVLINRAVAVAQVPWIASSNGIRSSTPRKANFIAGSGIRKKRRFPFTGRLILRAPNRNSVSYCESWRPCAAQWCSANLQVGMKTSHKWAPSQTRKAVRG
jgi:RNA polymerase sigma-70 factor (ECF subfamily)